MRPAASRSSAGALSRALPAPLARQCGTHSRVIGTAQLRQISSTQGLLLPGSETKSEPAPARKLARYSYPSLESIAAEPPPRRFSEFDNETIALLAGEGVYGAFKERLLREIMRVDRCSYVEAYRVLGEMNVCNEQGMWLRKLPYTLGIGGTAAVGTLAVPAVFHRDFAMWFCASFVKEDLPDPATLDTMWKVGTWTWTWMEPAIGTASFVLLALQLVRSHMQKIDLKPYRGLVSSWRADRLHRTFPQYEREIVRDYAKSDLWGRDTNKARKGNPANSMIPSFH